MLAARRLRPLRRREKALLAAAAFLLVGWLPLTSKTKQLRKQVSIERNALSTMQAQLPEIEELKNTAAGTRKTSALSLIERAIKAHGLSSGLKSLTQEGGGEVVVVLDATPVRPLLRLLSELQLEGLRIERATLEKPAQEGPIDARLTLR